MNKMKKILKQLIKEGSNLMYYAFAIVTIIKVQETCYFCNFPLRFYKHYIIIKINILYTYKYEDMKLFHDIDCITVGLYHVIMLVINMCNNVLMEVKK